MNIEIGYRDLILLVEYTNSRPFGTTPIASPLPRTAPDFLYAALDISACAAFFTESRMRLILSTNPNRKSGYVLGYFQSELSKLARCPVASC